MNKIELKITKLYYFQFVELKIIFYIVIGIGYFIFSAYKKVQEESAKQNTNKRKVVSPKQSTTFDEVVEQMKREMQTRKVTQQKKSYSPAKTQPKSQTIYHPPNQILVQEKQSNFFEEGNAAEPEYERALTAEEILHNERMKAAQSVKLENISDGESGYELNVREAFIGSIIFERKF